MKLQLNFQEVALKLKFVELISSMMPFNCSIERELSSSPKVLVFNDLTQLLKRIGVLPDPVGQTFYLGLKQSFPEMIHVRFCILKLEFQFLQIILLFLKLFDEIGKLILEFFPPDCKEGKREGNE